MNLQYSRELTRARRHLDKVDPTMSELVRRIGRCTLSPSGEPFAVLIRAIIAQLISTKAAATINARVETAADGKLTPEAILALGEQGLRSCGVSATKAQAMLDLATRTLDHRTPLHQLAEMSDEQVFSCLTAIRGIGIWTAEMFMIFCLGRLDVLPVGDLGLRAGVQDLYHLETLPSARVLRELAEPWQPYRSIATWYVWRSRGSVPQS